MKRTQGSVLIPAVRSVASPCGSRAVGTRFAVMRVRIRGIGETMLFACAVVLIVLWLVGVLGGYANGAKVDLLLVIAVLLLVSELVRGRSHHD